MPAAADRVRSRGGRARRLGAAALLFALAGCSLVPDYARPPVPLPSAWKEADGEGGATAWPAAGWWRGFGAPVLNDLIETARRNNADIGAAAARVLQADAQARIAGAPLLPSVEASSGVSRRWNGSASRSAIDGGIDDTGIGGRTIGRGTSTRYSAALSASYELDFFGANRAALAAAEASTLFSRYDMETVTLSTVAGVATTYFQALHFRDRLSVARRNLANAERVLAVVEARVRNGAGSALDLAQQRTAVAVQRAAIPPLKTRARQSEHALAILLGVPPEDLRVAGGSLMAIVPPAVAPGLPSGLLARRPDIQAAEARLVAANAEIGVARAAFFPSMDLTGSYGYGSVVLSSMFDPVSSAKSLAASLVQPIFQGGRLTGQLDLAKARHKELIENYRKAVISAFADVEDALVATHRTAEQENLQMDVAELAAVSYRLAQTRYREGLIDLLTLLDAQRSLYQAEDQLVQVRLARLEAAVSLFRALGGGWQDRAGQIAG